MAKLDLISDKAGADVYIEADLEKRMLFLPIQPDLVVDSRVYRIKYGVDQSL